MSTNDSKNHRDFLEGHRKYHKAGDPSVQSTAGEILIKNVNIFDGTSENLIAGKDVVLKNNKIDKLIPAGSGGDGYDQVIDGKGGYLTPGFCYMHEHIMFGQSMQKSMLGGDDYIHNAFVAAKECEQWLMMGITTIREVGGNVFGLKAAIDEGLFLGPRILPSGALISQTSGHADFADVNGQIKEYGGQLQGAARAGHLVVADGRDEVLKVVRRQLYLGATQIKIAGSGGVTSLTDPLYCIEWTEDEMRAAVEAAADYGTYVHTHIYNAQAIARSLNCGIKSIEHGMLIDEPTMALLAEKEAFFSPQTYAATALAAVETEPAQAAKLAEAAAGLDGSLKLAKKYRVKVLFGTDLLFDLEMRKGVLKEFGTRKPWFSSPEIMIQATGNAGEMISLSRRGYGAKHGVIEEGAFADVLIYNKNPLEDVAVVEDHENHLKLIVKDGRAYKNTL